MNYKISEMQANLKQISREGGGGCCGNPIF